MPSLCRRRLIAIALAICAAPLSLFAQLNGNTSGSTVSGYGKDDLNTSTTFDASYLNPAASPILDPFDGSTILDKLSGFSGPWVFAGAKGGDAENIAPIPASDFSLVVYSPWVVNNNPFQNAIVAPDGSNWNRGVYGQDAGGGCLGAVVGPASAERHGQIADVHRAAGAGQCVIA